MTNVASPSWLWISISETAAVIAVFLLLKQAGQIKPAAAQALHKQGAKVIDVRTEAEFREQHLPGAVNIPLDRLSEEIARHAPDKSKPLLLHCRSGARSGMGTGTLKKLGYNHVFNLGSYGQAESVLTPQR